MSLLCNRRSGVARLLPRDFFGRAAAMTKQGDLVKAITDRARSLDGLDWVPHWAFFAVQNEKESAAAAADGDTERQVNALRRASAFYMLATYPAVGDRYREWAYAQGRRTYLEACRLELAPVEVLPVAYGGVSFPVYLRRGAFVDPMLPLVVFLRGLDSTKEVTYWDERAILRRGFVVCSVDLPGMGENPCAMTVDTDRLFAAVIDVLLAHVGASAAVPSSGVVAWGLGFGGYWAYKLAAVDARVSGAISIGGPVHFSFSAGLRRLLFRWREIRFLTRLIRKAIGPDYIGSVASFVRQLSLVRNGTLGRTTKPILYINGDQDMAVSDREARVVRGDVPAGYESEREIRIFPAAGHLAVEVLDSEVLPWCLDWIERRFRRQSDTRNVA